MVGLIGLAFQLPMEPAFAQDPSGKELDRQDGEVAEPETKSVDGEASQTGGQKDEPGPRTPEERVRILGDLYTRLTEAKSAENATVIQKAIERIWLHSGSDTIDVLMSRSEKVIKDGKSELALTLLDSVIKLAPNFSEGWNRRAFVHFSSGDYNRALGDLRNVLALDHKHFQAISGLASILREFGDDKSALKAYRKVLEIHPYWDSAKTAVKELSREIEGQEL